MWEARVAAGQLAAAEAWVRETAAAEARAAGAARVDAYRAVSPDERLVLITHWPATPTWREPTGPSDLIERAHAWEFEDLPLT